MDASLSFVNNVLDSIKTIWHKQSQPKKYLAIISISIPSCILLRELYWLLFRKYHSLPPGPNGIPFLGFLVSWNAGTTARINLSNKYGPIFCTTLMGMPLIVLSSSKLMKEIFIRKEFLNRDSFFKKDTDYYHSNVQLENHKHYHFI